MKRWYDVVMAVPDQFQVENLAHDAESIKASRASRAAHAGNVAALIC